MTEREIYKLLLKADANMNNKELSKYIARGIGLERLNLAVKLDMGAYMPVRGHTDDGGWDLRMPDNAEDRLVRPNSSLVVDTGRDL